MVLSQEKWIGSILEPYTNLIPKCIQDLVGLFAGEIVNKHPVWKLKSWKPQNKLDIKFLTFDPFITKIHLWFGNWNGPPIFDCFLPVGI